VKIESLIFGGIGRVETSQQVEINRIKCCGG